MKTRQQIAEEAARDITEALAEMRSLPLDFRVAHVTKVILSAITQAQQGEYGRGVSAGKQEALKYTPEERDSYGKWTAQALEQEKKEYLGSETLTPSTQATFETQIAPHLRDWLAE